MRRARGFTLIEILIALGLAGIMSAFLLMLTRGQLMAYQMNDGVSRAQQNSRAGMDYIEQMLRRACGGIQYGEVGINVPGVGQSVQPCLKVWDGASVTSSSFTSSAPATLPDAIEVIYGTAPYTQLTIAPSFPTVTVSDTTGFAVNDYVLITDFQGAAELFQISSMTSTVTGNTAPGTFTFASPGGTPVAMPALGGAKSYTPGINDGVLKAESLSVYVSSTDGTLMVDSRGMLSTSHTTYAQPLIDGAVDLQVAVGIDADNNGLLAAGEWAGSSTALPSTGIPAALPWNVGTTQPLLRQLRVTLLVQTSDKYPGTLATALGPYEDRTSYPAAASPSPRYRALSMTVAPRAWNLTN
jgi:prepilin-type N-terminal cleavage/methylation domain-containing protein